MNLLYNDLEDIQNNINETNLTRLVPCPVHELFEIDEIQIFHYTGARVIIPAKSYFNLSFMVNYHTSKPKFISISKGDNEYDELASANEGYYTSSCSYSGYSEYETEIYVWASFESNGSAKTNVQINGFYLTKQEDIE